MARVNGEEVKRAELERAVKNLEGRAGQPLPAERRSEVYRNMLDQIVSFTLLKQESRARKISVADAEVDAQLAQMRQQFTDEQAFTKALAGQDLTLEKLKDDTRTGMQVSKMLETELSPKIAVQEKNVADFYAQNPDKFKQEESVRASHILIRADAKADPATKERARQRAAEVLKKAKSGADFAALAKEYSADGSAAQGGDLGFFGRGQMAPPFENAAFALKPGEISEVVQSDFGFHVIRLTDHRPARTVPLAEVGGRINQYLIEQRRQQLTDEFVAKLKSKGKVEILI
ncbi:MAG: peptidylprolyl isomerase [Acidobacteria bacterium]|nr:peptidylprolyl isomerase [Acidobacteriota bacterium]